MSNLRLVTVIAALFLCGCSSIEGIYAPACVAYEGDEIELVDGNFTWRRFTDQRHVDENGEAVDPFPNYPKNGSYEYRDPMLVLSPHEGAANSGFFPLKKAGVVYLLTEAENQRYELDGEIAECALRRQTEN